MIDLTKLQKEMHAWSTKNVDQGSNMPPVLGTILGAVEELGELVHAHLKGEHGIRYTECEVRALKKDALGDVVLCLANYCEHEDINLEHAILDAWKVVSQRDWKKYPLTGKPPKE